MRMLGLLRRVGPGLVPCALIVSLVVHAARAHAERRRDAPICAYRVGVPGPKCPDFFRMSVTFSWHNQYSLETALTPSNFPMRGFNFQCADLEIFTLVHP